MGFGDAQRLYFFRYLGWCLGVKWRLVHWGLVGHGTVHDVGRPQACRKKMCRSKGM